MKYTFSEGVLLLFPARLPSSPDCLQYREQRKYWVYYWCIHNIVPIPLFYLSDPRHRLHFPIFYLHCSLPELLQETLGFLYCDLR